MKPLAINIKLRILELAKEGKSSRQIGEELQISHMSVTRTLKSAETSENVPSLMNKGGRPRKISDRAARKVGRLLTSNKIRSAKEGLSFLDEPATVWTLRRSLKRIGLKAKEKKKKPLLTKKNVKARKQFFDRYKDWTVYDWKNVRCPKCSNAQFSDSFLLFFRLFGLMKRKLTVFSLMVARGIGQMV